MGLISITGCYTQLAVRNDYEVEEQPTDPYPDPRPEPNPCMCIDPDPPHPPVPDPIPIYDPPEQPTKERPYITRNPQIDRSGNSRERESVRNTGGRNTSGGRGRR
jgi:hypothetical protein